MNRNAAAPPVPRDPGVQPERTALAWSRTGMALLANALLVLRAGWSTGSTAIAAVGALLLLACAAAFVFGAWRRQRLVSGRAPLAPPALAVQAAALVMLVACGAGVASIWVRQAGPHDGPRALVSAPVRS